MQTPKCNLHQEGDRNSEPMTTKVVCGLRELDLPESAGSGVRFWTPSRCQQHNCQCIATREERRQKRTMTDNKVDTTYKRFRVFECVWWEGLSGWEMQHQMQLHYLWPMQCNTHHPNHHEHAAIVHNSHSNCTIMQAHAWISLQSWLSQLLQICVARVATFFSIALINYIFHATLIFVRNFHHLLCCLSLVQNTHSRVAAT